MDDDHIPPHSSESPSQYSGFMTLRKTHWYDRFSDLPWERICAAWPHAVTKEAIEEALRLAGNVLMEARAVPTVARAARRAVAA